MALPSIQVGRLPNAAGTMLRMRDKRYVIWVMLRQFDFPSAPTQNIYAYAYRFHFIDLFQHYIKAPGPQLMAANSIGMHLAYLVCRYMGNAIA